MLCNKRNIGILLVAMAALLLMPLQAIAADPIDLNRDCSLTVSYQDGTVPLAGADFSIYLVAAADQAGTLTVTEDFSRYPVSLPAPDNAQWITAASTLEAYALRDGLAPLDSGTTDSEGLLTFHRKLDPGLYLLVGSRHRQDGKLYEALPSLVLLPAQDNGVLTVMPKFEIRPEPSDPMEESVSRKVLKIWKDDGYAQERPREILVQLLRDGQVYDTVTLNGENNWRYTWEELDGASRWTLTEKEPDGYWVEITREGITFLVTNTWAGPDEPAPTEPSSTEPTQAPTPILPVTGQLWWPVPLLVCGGLLLIAVGLILRRGNADET